MRRILKIFVADCNGVVLIASRSVAVETKEQHEMNSQIKLVSEGGTLHTLKSDISDKLMSDWFTGNPIILRRYNGGDVDTIDWPFSGESDKRSLAIALRDAQEMGIIPSVQSVILPDETEFNIDLNL